MLPDIMNEYTETILDFEDDVLKDIRRLSARNMDNVPILRKDAAALLSVLVTMHKPLKILEAGTAVGYSAILLARFCLEALSDEEKKEFRIDTVELSEERTLVALKNIERAGLSSYIRVINGDAVEVFNCIGGQYDMVFVDSSKGHYIEMYDDMKRLLKIGGLLVCDDVIFYGKINDDPKEAPHKHRTIVGRLRAFLDKLAADKDFVTSLIDTGDGMAIAVKKGNLSYDNE